MLTVACRSFLKKHVDSREVKCIAKALAYLCVVPRSLFAGAMPSQSCLQTLRLGIVLPLLHGKAMPP